VNTRYCTSTLNLLHRSLHGCKEPTYLKVFRLYLQGYSCREIARLIYGDETREATIRSLLRYARKRITARPYRLVDSVRQIVSDDVVNELVNSRDYIGVKIKRGNKDMYARQIVSHEQLIYYIFSRLGFDVKDTVVATAKYYHYKYFKLFYNRYGRMLRCWRNGGNKNLFSFTLESLAYCIGIVYGALYLHGYHLKHKVDDIIRSLLPSRKQVLIYQFYVVFAEVGGAVLGRILYPHL